MAKRFTDTEKWKKEFIKGLSPKMKLLWFYILDDCDHCGMWQVDMEVASLRIGEKITYEEAFIALGSQFRVFGKNKWFIEDFVSFQYGQLRPSNRMHQAVINTLTKHHVPVVNGLIRPLEGLKVQVQEKVKEKEQEQVTAEPENSAVDPVVIDPRETLDERLNAGLDEIWIEAQRLNWRHIDFDLELFTFIEKVRGSPSHYATHTSEGFKQAFLYQLKNAKKKSNGKGYNKNDRTEFNQNELAIIAAHANGGIGS